MSTPFDAGPIHTPFNWYFWLACGLVTIVGSLVLYAVLYVQEEFELTSHSQQDFEQAVYRYLGHRNLVCNSTQYTNDLLLKKINNTIDPLPSNYVPESLVPLDFGYAHPRVGRQMVRNDIKQPLQDMLGAARASELDLRVNSAYRSYQRQDQVYRANTDDVFVTKPEKAARPGYSEHQLGTAVDISLYPGNGQAGYDWLQENAYRYGFVLSYPDGAEDVTEFLFEPWHWRYVGAAIAKHIHENNMLFNHERTLLLPSPIQAGTELPYEYTGRDLWVWKSMGNELEPLVSGWQEPDFVRDIPAVLAYFKEGVLENGAGSIVLPVRDWIVTSPSSTYVDRDGHSWLRTALASPLGQQEIERLEVLYRDDLGYMVISYQTESAGDRLVREFTHTCGIK